MNFFVYNTLGFSEKITSFSFFEYFDAFALDVNVVNFVHYGKSRLRTGFLCGCSTQFDLCRWGLDDVSDCLPIILTSPNTH